MVGGCVSGITAESVTPSQRHSLGSLSRLGGGRLQACYSSISQTSLRAHNAFLRRRKSLLTRIAPVINEMAVLEGRRGRLAVFGNPGLLNVESAEWTAAAQIVGLMAVLLKLMDLDQFMPDFSTLCRRQRGLPVTIPYCSSAKSRRSACRSFAWPVRGAGLEAPSSQLRRAITGHLASGGLATTRDLRHTRSIETSSGDQACKGHSHLQQSALKERQGCAHSPRTPTNEPGSLSPNNPTGVLGHHGRRGAVLLRVV